MGVRLGLDDLPPRYRAQAELQILQRKSERLAGNRAKSDQFRERNGQNREIQPKNSQKRERFTKDAPESEKRYYREIILPKVAAGLVAEVREQVRFDLLPEKEYCGLKLPAAHYTPDFVLTYADGTVEVVEVKSKFTRRAQRDYIYRRRLFIDLYAAPRGWKFTEYITDGEG